MGYRHYFYKVNKEDVKTIKDGVLKAIFNLVFILKTTDWEKETILFYGW